MENISEAYALILNLRNAADFHKRHCDEPACGVSLMQLKNAARVIYAHQWMSHAERCAVNKLMAEWPF